MRRIVRFRKRPRRGIEGFDPGQRMRFWPEKRRHSPLRRMVAAARPFVLFGVLAALWVGYDPALIEPPALLSTGPERVDEQFTRCGRGRGHACVVDGDTFKLGQRRIRIIGIDAPETHPARCAEEARLGEEATAKLVSLLNEGPFEMVAWAHNARDQYGRDLRQIRRKRADGSEQSIADDMRASGLAHRYAGFKIGWC